MKHLKTRLYVQLLTFLLILTSCKDGNGGKKDEPTKTDEFPRKEMLKNWSENIIIPAYENFSKEANEMHKKTSDFTSNPSIEHLTELRNSWEDAYKAYQKVALFNIGKAKAVTLIGFLNVYPVNTQKNKPKYSNIDKNIKKGTYDLNLDSEKTKQGFGALDYMLNGLADTDNQILHFYTINSLSNNYKKYLNDLSSRIKKLSDEVLADWKGDFKDKFIENDGNSGSSSVNIFANAFVKYFEVNVREAKIATPSGVREGVEKDAKRVEAYYKKNLSKKLFLEALEAVKDFYNGKSFDGDKTGASFKQYLENLDKEDLAKEIDRKLSEAIEQGEKLNDNFITQVETDNAKMIATFQKLQHCVRVLKTDMLSTLNIQITYQDSDGD